MNNELTTADVEALGAKAGEEAARTAIDDLLQKGMSSESKVDVHASARNMMGLFSWSEHAKTTQKYKAFDVPFSMRDAFCAAYECGAMKHLRYVLMTP